MTSTGGAQGDDLAPSVPAVSDMKHGLLVSAVADRLTEALAGSYPVFDDRPHENVDEGNVTRHNYLTKGLLNYHPSTLRRLLALRSETKISWDCYANIDLIISTDIPVSEEFISDYLNLLYSHNRVHQYPALADALVAFSALSHYRNLVPNDLDHDYPEERLRQATVILELTRHFKESSVEGALMSEHFEDDSEVLKSIVKEFNGGAVQYLSDPVLREMITEKDAETGAITKTISERGLFIYDDIIEVLSSQKSNPAQALSNGSL